LLGTQVNLGTNVQAEYTSLNKNFHNRGKRIEEQIQLLRQLWTQELVTFNGKWHTIPDAGLNPLPIQQPIPLWLGAMQSRCCAELPGWGMAGFLIIEVRRRL